MKPPPPRATTPPPNAARGTQGGAGSATMRPGAPSSPPPHGALQHGAARAAVRPMSGSQPPGSLRPGSLPPGALRPSALPSGSFLPGPLTQPPPGARPGRGRKPRARGRPGGSFTQHRRLDRLRSVLEANPRGLPLEALAAMLHVTTRSVRRYLKELSRLTELESIPAGHGTAHEWRIKPSERGRAVALRRTQAYGLLATRSIFDVFRGTALFDELEIGLGMVSTLAQRPTRARAGGDIPLDQRLEQRFRYVPAPARSYAGRGEVIDELFRAVAECRETRVRLTSREAALDVEPFALVAQGGDLYCVARPLGAAKASVFPIDELTEVTPHEKRRFLVPADFDLAAFLHGAFGVAAPEAEHRVIVEFDAAAAPQVRARKWHPSQRIATAPDGRVRLSFVLPELTALTRWVLSFGARARVVEPVALRDAVASELRAAAARYA